MKIIAVVSNEQFKSKYLVEVTGNELALMTNKEERTIRQENKEVGMEYEINNWAASANVIRTLALNEEYESLLEKQRKVVRAMESLQKPLVVLRDKIKTVPNK
jgi:hypothetical protein